MEARRLFTHSPLLLPRLRFLQHASLSWNKVYSWEMETRLLNYKKPFDTRVFEFKKVLSVEIKLDFEVSQGKFPLLDFSFYSRKKREARTASRRRRRRVKKLLHSRSVDKVSCCKTATDSQQTFFSVPSAFQCRRFSQHTLGGEFFAFPASHVAARFQFFLKIRKKKFSASLCHSSTSPHRFHIQFFRTYIFIIFSLRTRKKIINISTHTRGISAQKEKTVGEEARVCPKPRKISSLARFLTRRMEEKTCHVWLAE